MSALSAETRRLLDLSRNGDAPTPARELAVRNRLVARLGVTALAGAAGASAALGAAEAASAAGGASAITAGAPGAAVGSAAANGLSAGATTATLAKTVATLAVVAGLGAGVWKGDEKVDPAAPWPAAAAGHVKHAVKRAWQIVTNSGDDGASSHAPDAISPPISAEAIHERLIAIARRSHRPVAREAELVLILAAERALGEGDIDRAERYLDRHRARFSGGELSADREALRVLCERARRGTNF